MDVTVKIRLIWKRYHAWKIFYDCGGDYRIPIADGYFSLKKIAGACRPGEICLADLLRADSAFPTENAAFRMEDREPDIEIPSDISESDLIENASRELYLALNDAPEQTEDEGMTDADGLFSKTPSLERVDTVYMERL